MRKRLGVGAESLEFPVVPWGLIVVENHPGQQQGEVARPARLSSRPHKAPRGSRGAWPRACLSDAKSWSPAVRGIQCSRSCQVPERRSFPLSCVVSLEVPGT